MTDTPATYKLDIGDVFSRTFDIYKQSIWNVWAVALIVLIPTNVISLLIGTDTWWQNFLSTAVFMVGSAILVGAFVRVVQDVEADGRVDVGIGAILKSVMPVILPLIVVEVIIEVALVFSIALVILIPLAIFLAALWSVAVPALVVENLGPLRALGRSAELTRENRWRIIGVAVLIVVFFIILGVLIFFFSILFASPVLYLILVVIAGVVIYPYMSIIRAVLYYELLRVKGEAAPGPGSGISGSPGAPPAQAG